jgi:hypothetical protein
VDPALQMPPQMVSRPVVVKKQKEYKRECGYCGEIFISHSHTARYCPRPKMCRDRAYRDRRRRD